MKKLLHILIFVFSVSICSAQMQPADSLLGTYAGQYWLANPATSPWVTMPDTLFVQNIDSINCKIDAYNSHFSVGYSSASGGYYTVYFSCNDSTSPNNSIKFYSGDSIRMIYDNLPQPPPNPPYSFRFYGKRISNKTADVHEQLSNEMVKVFPNPCSNVLTIDSKKQIEEIIITDLMGREMKKEKMKLQINVGDLPEGIYFVKMKTEKGYIVRKITIQY